MFHRYIRHSSLCVAFLFSLTIQAMDPPLPEITFTQTEGEGYRILTSNLAYDSKIRKPSYEATFSEFFKKAKTLASEKLFIAFFGRLSERDFIELIKSSLESHIDYNSNFTTIIVTDDPAKLNTFRAALNDYKHANLIRVMKGDIKEIMVNLTQAKDGKKAIIFSPKKGGLHKAIMDKHAVLKDPTPKTILADSMVDKDIAKRVAVEGCVDYKLPRIKLTSQGISFENGHLIRESLKPSLQKFLVGVSYIIPISEYKNFIEIIGLPKTMKSISEGFLTHAFLIFCTSGLTAEQRVDALYGEIPILDHKEEYVDFLPFFSRAFRDPASQKLFSKPLLAPSGYSYDEDSCAWIQKYGIDPLMGNPLKMESLKDQKNLECAIRWFEEKNIDFEMQTLETIIKDRSLEANLGYCLSEYLENTTMRLEYFVSKATGYQLSYYNRILNLLRGR